MNTFPSVHLSLKKPFTIWMVTCLLLVCFNTNAQTEPSINTSIDTTNIRIGEQINYNIKVETEQGATVVFPEGQTFSPLEMIESYKVDTSYASAKMTLIKKYGLTQFDSGTYKIPRQRLIIEGKTIQTDSFEVMVANVHTDTTKQGLYDIKPAIELPKDYSDWWKYVLWILPIVIAIGAFLYWLIKRNKKQKEAEKYVPPFELALSSLQELDQTDYIASSKYKEYYSVLTDTLRRYYEEKVYNKALESTTDELIDNLTELKDSDEIDFLPETISNIKDIFKRADLVKFARINPPEGKAKADRLAIEEIVKETKEALPEPTLEELMKDQDFRENLARKRNRKTWLTGVAGVLGILLIATGIGIAIKGYDEVKDFLFGNETRELLEGEWITSEYGYPNIIISTPEALLRSSEDVPEELKGKVDLTLFGWETEKPAVSIVVSQIILPKGQEFDIEKAIQGNLATLEQNGAKIGVVKNDKHTTPNGAEGVKTHGSIEIPVDDEKTKFATGEYAIYTFSSETNTQQVILFWVVNDEYSLKIANRIQNSIELQKVKAE